MHHLYSHKTGDEVLSKAQTYTNANLKGVFKTHENNTCLLYTSPIESVQEMYLGIALHLAMPEKQNRLQWVKKFYDILSRLEVTMATPTPVSYTHLAETGQLVIG